LNSAAHFSFIFFTHFQSVLVQLAFFIVLFYSHKLFDFGK
jgi:hypothetical protein